MRRLALMCVVCLLSAFFIARLGVTPSQAQQPKRQPPAKKKGGIDFGTLWSFTATDSDGKQILFRYRATDLVLYDPDTNEVIGKSEGIRPGRSRVTLESNCKFPAVFEISVVPDVRPPQWSGRAQYDGRTWDVQLRSVAK